MSKLDRPSSIVWYVAFLASITAAIIILLLGLTKEACVTLVLSGMSGTFIISLEEAVIGDKGRLALVFCGYGFYLLGILAGIVHALFNIEYMRILMFPWLAAGLMCFVALSIWVLINSLRK